MITADVPDQNGCFGLMADAVLDTPTGLAQSPRLASAQAVDLAPQWGGVTPPYFGTQNDCFGFHGGGGLPPPTVEPKLLWRQLLYL